MNKHTLNKEIPIPLYYQLKQILLEEINSERYKENSPIPTELKLSEIFNISRPTVSKAIKELVNEGHLKRIKGSGTFVTRPKINQEFIHIIENYNDEMLRKKIVPKTKVLKFEIVKANADIASFLNLNENDKVFKLVRLRLANDEPILIVTTYIPHYICPEIKDVDFNICSLYKTLDENNLHVKKVQRILEVRQPTKEDIKILEMQKDTPLFYFITKAYLANGVPIEYSKCKYRGDRNKFIVEIEN